MKGDDTTNNPQCTSCLSKDSVIPIVYGLPGPELMNKSNVVLGGCIVTDSDPDWKCDNCGNFWGANTYNDKKFGFSELKRYLVNGSFIFRGNNNLREVCNASKHSAGVYVVYAINGSKSKLVYIGISGKVLNDGSIKIRKGGIFDRLVNGKQFGKSRRISWKERMIAEDIEKLYIEWYDTYTDHHHIPKSIEGQLLQTYYNFFFKLPSWNKEY